MCAQRKALEAVRRAEEEAKKLKKEMTEAKRVNVAMEKKHQLFLRTLERLNQTAQEMTSLRVSEADIEQKALVFWFNSSRGLRRASWLLRTAVARHKAIRSLTERVTASGARRVTCKVFNCWSLLVRVHHLRDNIACEVLHVFLSYDTLSSYFLSLIFLFLLLMCVRGAGDWYMLA